MSDKKTILVLSDHPLSPSGVGIQTKYMIEAMLKTGKYRFWSVVGLGYKAAAEKTEELMNEVNSGELEYLSLGFFDRVKSIIKSVGDIIKNAFTQAIKYLMDKASNFAEFLGLQPQIRFNNTVKW